MILYTNATQTKYYRLPADLDLSDGDFTLLDSAGNERLVDEQAVAPYEVSEDEVKAHLKVQAGAAFDQLKASLLGSVQLKLAEARQEVAAQREAREATGDPEWAQKLLGFSAQHLADDPQVGKDWLRSVLDGAKTVLEGAASSDPAEQQAARDVMDGLRGRLTAAGIEANERMTEIPDQLRDNVLNRNPQERADDLNGLATELEAAAAKWGTALRAQAVSLQDDEA